MRLLLWAMRVCPPVVKGSPVGGFITLVWRAESEFVLRGERHSQLRDGGRERKPEKTKELWKKLKVG